MQKQEKANQVAKSDIEILEQKLEDLKNETDEIIDSQKGEIESAKSINSNNEKKHKEEIEQKNKDLTEKEESILKQRNTISLQTQETDRLKQKYNDLEVMLQNVSKQLMLEKNQHNATQESLKIEQIRKTQFQQLSLQFVKLAEAKISDNQAPLIQYQHNSEDSNSD